MAEIRPGDLVRANVRGKLVHGIVSAVTAAHLDVTPIERQPIRRVKRADVIDHWTHQGAPRADGNPDQRSLADLWDP